MTAPTPTEDRLRAMLVELADSTPIRPEPMVLPAVGADELDDRRPVAPVPDDLGLGDEHDGGRVEHDGGRVEHDGGRIERAGGGPAVGHDDPDGPSGRDGRGRPDGTDEVSVARARRFGGSRLAWVLTAVAGVLVVVMAVTLLRVGDAADPFARDPSDVPAVDLGALAGGRLAFVIDNDLFVADATDGVTRRITDVGRGNEVSFVGWSHDGQWVSFMVHDQDGLWVVRRDGSERHRLPGSPSSYAWSPTNDELVYALADEVRLAQVDGTSRALEGTLPPAPYTNVVWSPDGNRVAFAGAAGNLSIGTLEGRPGAGWGSGVSPPVRNVVAWPRSDYLVVEQLSVKGSLLAFDPDTSHWTHLVTIDHWFGGSEEVGIDPTATRMAIVTDADLWSCPLDRGIDAACTALGVPGAGLTSPVFVPGSEDVSFMSTPVSAATGSTLVTISFAADATTREPVVIGRVASVHRGAIDIGSTSFGVVPEHQIPVGNGFLVRVDERSVDLMTAGGSRRTVVAGDRFLTPADEYPGGSGLAYWHP